MDLTQFVGLAGVLVVLAIVELVKRSMQDEVGTDHLPKRFIPILDVGVGIVFNLLLARYLQTDLALAGFVGLVTGLSAAGLYSGAKAVTGN